MSFREQAAIALNDSQLRTNLRRATRTIRSKRAAAVEEVNEWEVLRQRAAEAKARTLAHLDEYLVAFADAVEKAGGQVHWARDAEEANRVVSGIVTSHGADEVVKVKSLTTDEIGLNGALEAAGIHAVETDLAELIVQLARDAPSHILVPAIHRNRDQIRDLFERTLGVEDLSDDPAALAEVARRHLRDRFLSARVAISGANFGVAATGALGVVESEGNGRMCLTLPRVLITVLGIEKLVARWQDVAPLLQVLARSSTGERMNPYTSIWTGVTGGDGPEEFHVVLLDAGRTTTLADPVGRDALRCIRCSACLNICPVYERTGGHAYESVYPGPIGAILSPQLAGMERGADLPMASSLCGACADVCPVKIDIPNLLVHLRGRAVSGGAVPIGERLAMRLLGKTLASRRRYESAQRAARLGRGPLYRARLGALGHWGSVRELPAVPDQSFREWWRARS